jgi:hypothetical protein
MLTKLRNILSVLVPIAVLTLHTVNVFNILLLNFVMNLPPVFVAHHSAWKKPLSLLLFYIIIIIIMCGGGVVVVV